MLRTVCSPEFLSEVRPGWDWNGSFSRELRSLGDFAGYVEGNYTKYLPNKPFCGIFFL